MHMLVGLVFLAQAGVLCALLFTGRCGPAELAAYAVLLLAGWAAGVTLGHGALWTTWTPERGAGDGADSGRRPRPDPGRRL